MKPLRTAGPVIVLVLWQVTTMTGLVPPTVLPPPSEVFVTGWELLQTGELQMHLLVSLERIAYAVLLGVSIGLVMALLSGIWKVGDALIDPLMQMMRTVPVLALVPLFILWFGIGEPSKVLMIALAVVFPVYLNTYAGIRGVDRKLMEVGTIVRLTPIGRIRHIVLPGALPGFLTGLRMSLGVAWLILVISEQVNANEGVGYLMNNARLYLRTDVIVLGILIYAAAGYLSDLLVRLIEKRTLAWRQGLETV
ncbi:ABC transporter permease [Microbacterium sp. LTA6]|uniref:ABC transporter permease n=1 Tax=unclassified Microbacterium TaxID=2609290 RepID=UPI0031386366